MPVNDRKSLLCGEVEKEIGVRGSEICGLRWRDLSERGDAGQVTVYGKGGKTRIDISRRPEQANLDDDKPVPWVEGCTHRRVYS